jgi:hypothetical protein
MKMHSIKQVDVKGNHGGIKGLVKRPIPGGLVGFLKGWSSV